MAEKQKLKAAAMGGGKGRSRTQRKHFRQNRENVWKRSKSDDNSGWEPFATQNPSFDEYYKVLSLPFYPSIYLSIYLSMRILCICLSFFSVTAKVIGFLIVKWWLGTRGGGT